MEIERHSDKVAWGEAKLAIPPQQKINNEFKNN
jgi:hypothetical protein